MLDATRLSGSPLQLRNSKIDYIIVTQHTTGVFGFGGQRGLAGEEITAEEATVHTELLAGNPDRFRQRASDHLPVTVSVRVTDDTD